MSFLDTKHKRKSATWTTIIGIVILFLIFNFGLRYFDPPKEYGISVNFGTSNVGSGDVQPTEALKPAVQESEAEPVVKEEVVEEPVVEEQVATAPPKTETAAEEVLTQENEEVIAIKKQKEAERKKEIEEQKKADKKAAEERKKIEKENRRIVKEKQDKIDAENKRIEKERQEKAAKKKNVDALLGGIGNTNGKADGGEGDDKQAGDKGKSTGDPNASGYYGNSGTGSGGNYQLGNRKAVTTPKPIFDCNETGKVVVRITVDKSGNVIAAQPGRPGTTNTLACLLKRAKEAAMKTKFSPDPEAAAKQMGKIIYNFSYD